MTNAHATTINPDGDQINVTLPDGNRVKSTNKCLLDIPQLPTAARHGYIIPGLAAHSLLSVVTLCNAGCEITFTKYDATVKYKGETIMKGRKCTRTGLWMIALNPTTIPTPSPSKHTANALHTFPPQNCMGIPKQTNPTPITTLQEANNMVQTLDTSSKEEMAKFHHQTLGSPPVSTLLRVLRKHPDELSTFPGITRELITKHLPPSTATAKGHMTRTRKGLRSTQKQNMEIPDAREELHDMEPAEQVLSAIDDELFCYSITTDNDGNVVYSDLPRRFPIESYRGMNYFFVAYIYKCNYILIRPMKSRKDEDMVRTFQMVYDELEAKGHRPALHVLDNECSRAVKNYITSQQTNIQLVEPHNHRVNAAEPAVKCVKYHTIASFATLDPDCPIQLWCRFMDQVEITMNLLRTSRRDNNKSAYEDFHNRKFDWNRTPMAPLGTRALAFKDSSDRAAWQPRGVDCW